MAVDSKDKRAAVIGTILPVPYTPPTPNGIGIDDRPMMVWVYPGLFYSPILARYVNLSLSTRDITLTLQTGRVQALNLRPRDITLTMINRLYTKDY